MPLPPADLTRLQRATGKLRRSIDLKSSDVLDELLKRHAINIKQMWLIQDLKEETKQVDELIKLLERIGNEDTMDKLVYSLKVTSQGHLVNELHQPNKTDDKWQEDPNNTCTLSDDQKILESARIKLKNSIDLSSCGLLVELKARGAILAEQTEEIEALTGGENNRVDRLLNKLQRKGEMDECILDKLIFALKASEQSGLIKHLRQPTPGKADYYWDEENTDGVAADCTPTTAAAAMDTDDGHHGNKTPSAPPPPYNESEVQPSPDRSDSAKEIERLAELPGVLNTPVDSIPPPPPYQESVIEPCLQAFRRNELSLKLEYGQTTEKLQQEGFLDVNRVVMIVHGFQNDVTKAPWMHEMKDAILKEADVTVILVGWGRGADLSTQRYRDAVSNTQVVGHWLATVATYIKDNASLRNIDIWGIGHSLGAHVLGKAGRDSGAFRRITALDPAGPMMEQHNETMRLCRTDATFVDVIHTDGCAEDWRALHFGTLIPLGTIDFYPNYGLSPQRSGQGFNETDSHSLPVKLFIWSISHKESFKTSLTLTKEPKYKEPVKDTIEGPMAQMGFYADQPANAQEGLYYLPIAGQEPWESKDMVDSTAQKQPRLWGIVTNMVRDWLWS